MNPEAVNAVATEVLEKCQLEDGKLVMKDGDFVVFGERIRQSDDKKGWGVAMIALANRLRVVPGAAHAAERALALAAVALGDAELNRLVSKEASRKSKP